LTTQNADLTTILRFARPSGFRTPRAPCEHPRGRLARRRVVPEFDLATVVRVGRVAVLLIKLNLTMIKAVGQQVGQWGQCRRPGLSLGLQHPQRVQEVSPGRLGSDGCVAGLVGVGAGAEAGGNGGLAYFDLWYI